MQELKKSRRRSTLSMLTVIAGLAGLQIALLESTDETETDNDALRYAGFGMAAAPIPLSIIFEKNSRKRFFKAVHTYNRSVLSTGN